MIGDLHSPISDKEKKKNQIATLVKHLEMNLTKYNSYFFYFVICEVLNFINVIVQIYLINAFLGGVFLSYGFEIIKFTVTDQEYRTDALTKIFPKTTECRYNVAVTF